jgi:hypothetical protein
MRMCKIEQRGGIGGRRTTSQLDFSAGSGAVQV